MKCFLFNLIIASCMLFLFACQNSEKPETAFFRDFNLGATVKQMNVAQLQEKSGGGSATTALGETTERRREFDLEYLLNEQNGELLDETVFLNKLKSEIAGNINDAGVKSNGEGANNDGFYFNYSTGENNGSIEVIGAKVEENKYKLWCVMRESAGIGSNK